MILVVVMMVMVMRKNELKEMRDGDGLDCGGDVYCVCGDVLYLFFLLFSVPLLFDWETCVKEREK